MRAVYDKEMREIAKRKGKSLAMISVDGKTGKRASFTFAGPVDDYEVEMIEAFWIKFIKLRTGRLGRNKKPRR